MNTKTLTKVNRFGKVGKIVMTVLMIAAIIVTVLIGSAAVYVTTLPKDAVKVTVTNHAEFKVKKSCFSSVWAYLAEGFSSASDEDPSDMLTDGKKILPEEDTEINTDLEFLNRSYSSAIIHTEDGEKIIDAKSSPAEYRSSDLVAVLAFGALVSASAAVVFFMLLKLFKSLSVCESPFCTDFVSKLRAFGYSLLPAALLASVGETLAVRFLTAGESSGVSVQWGILVAFAVTMCLTAVFRYGVQLQKESDETL